MAKVLLIDDHADLRDVMKELLEMHGHHVRFAESGEEAWSSLASPEPTDVVIADQRLPGMTGMEFLQQVRSQFRSTHLPVILCSADSTLREEALSAGVDDFWVKGSDQIFDQIGGLQKRLDEIGDRAGRKSQDA